MIIQEENSLRCAEIRDSRVFEMSSLMMVMMMMPKNKIQNPAIPLIYTQFIL